MNAIHCWGPLRKTDSSSCGSNEPLVQNLGRERSGDNPNHTWVPSPPCQLFKHVSGQIILVSIGVDFDSPFGCSALAHSQVEL